LFEKTAHFAQEDGALEHHAALVALFEILEVASRADLKMDLIQELERQRQTLLAFRNNPEISEEALSGALYEIEQSSAACLPAWQDRPVPARERLADEHQESRRHSRRRLRIRPAVLSLVVAPPGRYPPRGAGGWTRPMLPLRDAAAIVLRLLRSSGRPKNYLATLGQFQLNLGGSAAQMVRITVDRDEPAIPEVSANKYFLNIRFTKPPAGEIKARGCERDVAFDLTFCNL
jgi:cell division protein ZapD